MSVSWTQLMCLLLIGQAKQPYRSTVVEMSCLVELKEDN